MGLRRRLERLEASAPATSEAETHLQDVEDWLTEHDIACGELDPADVPDLDERRRRADETFVALEDEWRRLGIVP